MITSSAWRGNDVLLKKAQRVRGKAAMAMIETNQPVRAYGRFHI